MEKENKNPHKGHRQRLKDKVRKFGLKSLSEHEIVELLLTYTIPQKDTNELAHDLIEKCGSISKVIDADYNYLQRIKGVGEETALFFKVLSSLIGVYKESCAKSEVVVISNNKDCTRYFRSRFNVGEVEHMHVACLSKLNRVVHTLDYYGRNDVEIGFSIKEFVEEINHKNVARIVLFHTHPHGKVNPSIDDITTTKRINDICNLLGIELADHLILNETEDYSMKKYGEMDKIKSGEQQIIKSKIIKKDIEKKDLNDIFDELLEMEKIKNKLKNSKK